MSVKDINIKNHTYYFFYDIIDIKDFDSNNIKIDKKSYKNVPIYYTGYVTIKKDLKIYNVNPLYLILDDVNRYFEEINGNKFLTLVPTNKSKEKTKKYEELWIKIKRDLDNYDEKYLEIKFDSDDNLPLNKTIEIPTTTIVVRADFHENNKCHPQDVLDECLYKM